METIKIIDLLLKIANNEEVPEKIKWEDTIYVYSKYDKDYLEFPISVDEYKGLFNMKDSILTQYLNDEVEIIKDSPKTLEDILTPDELKCFEDLKELVTRLSDEDIKIMVKLLLGDEYDELVEKIRGEA